jgi:hypothetical protein
VYVVRRNSWDPISYKQMELLATSYAVVIK